jgi:enediyne biosynthesis protein E4
VRCPSLLNNDSCKWDDTALHVRGADFVKKIAAFATVALLGIALAGAGYWFHVRETPEPDDGPAKDTDNHAQAQGIFRDMTPTSGVEFTYRNGEEAGYFAILESVGGGVALIDYDGDGLLDLFIPGGGTFTPAEAELKKDPKQQARIVGHPCKLYKNLGNFQFRDVTADTGLDGIAFYTHGAAVADYNRDGWPDLLVTGYGRVALFKNVPDGRGGRRFMDVTMEAGLIGPHIWATSAGWGDLDGDGWPDLYICQYVDWSLDNNPLCDGYTSSIPRDVCPPRQFDARPHSLYRNQEGRTFVEVGKQAGLRTPRQDSDYAPLTHLSAATKARLRDADRERDFGKGLGVVLADLNGDGRPEIYVTNDTTDKFLYLNRSKPGAILLEEVGQLAGVATDEVGLANGSMGVDVGDYDGSGRPSLLVTNYENELHGLYRNVSAKDIPQFEYSTRTAGIDKLGRHYVGFGTGFLDLDNTGRLDVVIANGHVIRYPVRAPVRQRPILLQNQGPRGAKGPVQLVNITPQGGTYFQTDHQGRGVAIGDLDNDGRHDLVISHINAPVVLLRNESNSTHHWLGVELAGKDHADIVGARLTLEVGGRNLTRFATGGGSYLSSADRRHLFGLGNDDRVGRLTVVWPSGREQSWEGLAVDRYWRLTDGEPNAIDMRKPRNPRSE